MSSLEERIAALSPEKREAFLRQLQKKREEARRQIRPQPREGQLFPLSFAQERMWFLYQLDPNSPQYNVSITMCLSGRLDVACLAQSLSVLAQRHEAFRTTFRLEGEHPVQLIAPTGSLALGVTDLQGQADPQELFYGLANEHLIRPFDLEHGPVARAQLFLLADQEARLLLVMHHIVSDGWSLGVLAQELGVVYRALAAGQPVQLPELTVQCADFAIWQREWLQGETLEKLAGYWQDQLRGAPQILELPATRTRPPEQSFRGARLAFRLDEPLYLSLKALARAEGVTLFMVLFAGVAAYLSRLTGMRDIVLGTPITNRTHPETVGLVGVFVNTLALRVNLGGQPSVRELLQRVRQTALDGYAHEEMPFSRLVDLMRLDRSLSHSPLFQISFGLQENPLEEIALPELKVELLEIRDRLRSEHLPTVSTGMTMFDLTFHLSEIPGELGGWIEYSTDLFDAGEVSRLAAQYKTVLAAMAADPERSVIDLPLLSAADRQLMLKDWNATDESLPPELTLQQLFEAQVRATPERLAVREVPDFYEAPIELTYRELNARANQLARYLRRSGVGPDCLVGICAERSAAMIVAVLGVLKAGGAYVPLAPEYPRDRLAYMALDAKVSVLLTQGALADHLPPLDVLRICLDCDWPEIAQESTDDLENLTLPEHLAYVIYTSGSTGRPKGVLVAHRSITNLTLAQIRDFALDPGCRVLQFAAFSFDAAVSEIFTTLASGALLVLAPTRALLGEDFTQLLRREGITTVTLPPSMSMLCDSRQLPALQTLISAGEACRWELVDRWAKGRRLLNFYGPTEATVGACHALVEGRMWGPATVPIGRPIENVQLYVVDSRMNPVPVGMPGELLIGGMGLARGYLGRPELTAEKFVPDPFGSERGGRLYRTGDLVRYWPDGMLEFVGRIDNQVKLRGFRIELGEIEAVLDRHPAVRECAVGVREFEGLKQLVAYFIPEGEMPDLVSLRQYLLERLPEYMAPAIFVPVEFWPLTPNGKVDRAALPLPDTMRLTGDHIFVASRNGVEETLAQIWAELLRMERIGIYDNFFELGGDSILSIQMVARAAQAGVRLNPRQIFQYQTIAELAAVANTAPVLQAEQSAISGPVVLTPIQRWFFEQTWAAPQHWNQAVMVRPPERLEVAALRRAVAALLDHHDALRMRYAQHEDGHWEQIGLPPEPITPVSVVDWADQDETLLATAAAETQASLDLAAGPLLRVVYFDGGVEKAGRLLFVAHHLIVDGVSWRILLGDFRTAYEQTRQGGEIRLPAKTTSFKQWAERLQVYARTEIDPMEADYWDALTCECFTPARLDFAGGLDANTEATERTVELALEVEETRALLQDVPPVYNTQINDVLLTALVQSWEEWTGDSALIVDLEGHGREPLFDEVDLSRTVGWFTAAFPVGLNLGGGKGPGEALKQIKDQLRAIPGHGLSYGILRYLRRESLRPGLWAELPPASIGFNYLGQIEADPEWPLAAESCGPLRSPETRRPHSLELEARTVDGRLWIIWRYSERLHRRETMADLAARYLGHLRELIAHCQNPGVGGYTPSDFPEAELSQDGLDRVLAELEGLFD